MHETKNSGNNHGRKKVKDMRNETYLVGLEEGTCVCFLHTSCNVRCPAAPEPRP